MKKWKTVHVAIKIFTLNAIKIIDYITSEFLLLLNTIFEYFWKAKKIISTSNQIKQLKHSIWTQKSQNVMKIYNTSTVY